MKRPKFDSAIHVPAYIVQLGPVIEYNTSIFEGDLGVSKRIGREHTNHHEVSYKTITLRVRCFQRSSSLILCTTPAT